MKQNNIRTETETTKENNMAHKPKPKSNKQTNKTNKNPTNLTTTTTTTTTTNPSCEQEPFLPVRKQTKPAPETKPLTKQAILPFNKTSFT